jgi:ribonuclease HII
LTSDFPDLRVGAHMKPDLVLGIDEAGRGPGIGPMVLAAVALDKAAGRTLGRAGVKDSKAFGSGAAARAARAKLAALVHRHAAWSAVEICEVSEIDAYVARGALNELERERARDLIRRAPRCRRIIADGRTMFSALAAEFSGFRACDRAETAHLAVAAASVCAKALRDELFAAVAARYRQEFGELAGGGYMNPATHAFVAEYLRRHGCLPPEARKSWPWPGMPASQARDEADALPGARVR